MTIVVFVLILWVAAIALFYHQWGKINGLGSHQLDYVHANLEVPSKVKSPPPSSCQGMAINMEPELKVRICARLVFVNCQLFYSVQILVRCTIISRCLWKSALQLHYAVRLGSCDKVIKPLYTQYVLTYFSINQNFYVVLTRCCVYLVIRQSHA